MILMSLCSTVHVVRVHAIYDKSRAILGGLGAVLLFQVSLLSLSPSASSVAIALCITSYLLFSHPAPILLLRSTPKLCLSVCPSVLWICVCVSALLSSHFLFSAISFPC